MNSIDRNEYNLHIAYLIRLGTIPYMLLSVVIYLICGENPSIFWIFGTTAFLINSFTFLMIRPESESKNGFKKLIDSGWILSFIYILVSLSILGSLYVTNWPKGSYLILLLSTIGTSEVKFIPNNKIAYFQFLASSVIGFFGMIIAKDPFGMESLFIISLVVLLTWNFINQFFFNRFLKVQNKSAKIDAYSGVINTLSHELNNTSTILLGFSRILRKKSNNNFDELYKLDDSIHRMVSQINNMKSFEGLAKIQEEDFRKHNSNSAIGPHELHSNQAHNQNYYQ